MFLKLGILTINLDGLLGYWAEEKEVIFSYQKKELKLKTSDPIQMKEKIDKEITQNMKTFEITTL